MLEADWPDSLRIPDTYAHFHFFEHTLQYITHDTFSSCYGLQLSTSYLMKHTIVSIWVRVSSLHIQENASVTTACDPDDVCVFGWVRIE